MAVPRPKSPPEYPDLYGRRREAARVQMLEREIGFLEEELKSVEALQPVSELCKEVADFVVANADPLIPTIKKSRRSCRFWKWLCGCSRFSFSWICCCCCCFPTKQSCSNCCERFRTSCKCCSCSSCGTCPSCFTCKPPSCKCCLFPSSNCFKNVSCRSKCCNWSWKCCFPKCRPKCPKVQFCCTCSKTRCNCNCNPCSCCLCF